MLLVLLVTAVCVLLVALLATHLFASRQLPPGPWGLPVLGSLLRLSPATPYLSLTHLAQRYGPIYSLRLGRVLTVVLTDPRLIREALARDELSGRADLFLTHGIMKGYGLICAEGKRWREQRAFVGSTLKGLGMVRVGPGRDKLEERILIGVMETVEYLEEQRGREVDACRTLLHSVGNVVNDLVFGIRFRWDDPTWKWLQHLSEDGVKLIGVAGPLNFLPFLRFLPQYRRTIRFLVGGMNETHKEYQKIIDAHPDDREDDFIAAFKREREARGAEPGSFTTTQFHHLLGDLFGAGLDTTLTTLRWLFIFMAYNQDIQARVHRELADVCGGAAPRLEHTPSLPYLQAAIAETQRIRPVVPVGIPHGALRDTRLGGYLVPRGTMVVPLQWAVHMDPKHWSDPDTYNPDRFIDGDGNFFKPDAFMPFQTVLIGDSVLGRRNPSPPRRKCNPNAGRRACVGEELGRMLLLLYAGRLLHRFAVALPSPSQPPVDPLASTCGITLVPDLHRLHFLSRTTAHADDRLTTDAAQLH